jgi:REP element-mobilizing transposase RayT
MGQSLVKNYMHIIFSTKNRKNYITSENEQEIYNYFISLFKNIDSPVISIGGYQNHIHVLCLLSKKHPLIEVIRFVKSNSSRWISENYEYTLFSWQTGYGAFSVSPKDIDLVIKYIGNQHEHHRVKTFQEEFLLFLNKYDIPYNEKYIWD